MVSSVLEELAAFIVKVEVSETGAWIGNIVTIGGLGCGERERIGESDPVIGQGGRSLSLSGMVTQKTTFCCLYIVCAYDFRKDYDDNRLVSGILQLSSHTHLVLDETCLEPGKLDSNGVHNMAAICTLISQQKVDYDFHFYKLEFQTDIPVLVLSEGKSLLPVSCNVFQSNILFSKY
jgi:hypothetical protein